MNRRLHYGEVAGGVCAGGDVCNALSLTRLPGTQPSCDDTASCGGGLVKGTCGRMNGEGNI